MFTRGRLVPRQPRAIKRTTRTKLHHEGIYNERYINWNIDIFCYLFIRILASIVLQNARFNAVGVVLFRRNLPYFLARDNVIHVAD